MADLPPVIETLEHRWMRAWVGRDVKTLKALTSRRFRLVVGSKPSVMLDQKSFLDAVPDDSARMLAAEGSAHSISLG